MTNSLFHRSVFALIAICLGCVAAASAQTSATKKPEPEKAQANTAAASPAYAELLLKRTELQSELESLAIDYTEDYPKLKEIRFVLALVNRDIGRLTTVRPADSGKLTLALGKLMVRRIELETDEWKLQSSYKDEHPDVKRAKRRVEIYDKAINEILN